jgi:iron(III) transport system permease protein
VSGTALIGVVDRWVPNRTLAAWGTLTWLGVLLLPWAREGRDLSSLLAHTTGMALLVKSPLMVAIAGAALAAVALGVVPSPNAPRGRAALWVGGVGTVLSVAQIASLGRPLGPGGVVAVLGFLAVSGCGLALAGHVRADAFVAGAILYLTILVALFVLYPLWTVLYAAVSVQGRLTLDVVAATVRSPAFFLLDRPATPYHEPSIAVLVGAAGGLIATIYALATAGTRQAIRWGPLIGAGAFAVAALYLGLGALRNSLLLALVVGGIATVLGFLFALLGHRSTMRMRHLLGPFSLLPLITPPFVLGLAMIFMFGRRGFVTYQVLGLSTSVLFGPVGVAVTQILTATPIAYLILRGVVQAMATELEEAAETLGASRWHVLRTVVAPLARPGIANAFLLVAMESLGDFGTPVILGGGAPFLATEVYFALIGRFNPSEAAVYGVVLLAVSLAIFLAQYRWLGRASYVTTTGRPSGAQPRRLPPVLDYTISGVFLVWIGLVVVLYGSVFVGSVTKLWGLDYTFTLDHLRALSPTGWRAFWTTVRLATYAAPLAMLVGFLIGYLVTRYPFPGGRALEFSSMLSFAVPGTVMGIGYVLAFNQGVPLLTGTEFIIVAAFIFRSMPVGLRAGVAAIHQIDRSLEEASTMLRAGSATTLRRVVVPLVLPALFSGLVFAFVRAMTAVSQVIFLISPRTNLATTQILSLVEYGSQGRGAALASLLTLAMTVVILLLYVASRRLDYRAAGAGPGT